MSDKEQWIITLPEGYTLVPFDMGIAGMFAYRISDTQAHLGILSANAVVLVTRYTAPIVTPPPVPAPPNVVLYECRVDKLYIREIPDRTSPDMGSLKRGQRVGVVTVVTEGSETWGKLETGGYAAIKIGANVYLEKVETGG